MASRFSKSRVLGVVGTIALSTVALSSALVTSPASAYGWALTNGDFSAPGTNGSAPTGWTADHVRHRHQPVFAEHQPVQLSGAVPAAEPAPGRSELGFRGLLRRRQHHRRRWWRRDAGGERGRPDVRRPGRLLGGADLRPAPAHAAWAGAVFEVDFTSGAQSYVLRYFNPFTPTSGSYSGAPTSSGNTAYIMEPTLTNKVWYTLSGENLSTDIQSAFGLSTYTVTSVKYGNLEDATNTGSPYPNETSYWTLVSLGNSSFGNSGSGWFGGLGGRRLDHTAGGEPPHARTRPCACPIELHARQREQARDRDLLRQRALLPGQPQRGVRHRADPRARELHREQRDPVVQQPHAADRPHGRRLASATTRVCTATVPGWGSPTTTRSTTRRTPT